MRRAVLFASINVWEKYAVEMYGIMHNVRSEKKLRSGFEQGKR